MGQLDGKIALVTGSSRSIGKAIAIALAKEGASLVLAARNVEGLNATAKAIKTLGRDVEVVPTDIKIEQQIDNLFKRAMERFGRLDILVNNAGVFDGGPIDKISTEDWDNVIATNLRAPFLCTRAAFAIMKAQGGGRIINIGSISASRVRQNNAPYSSAKFGLVGLTHTTALEGREFNITCGILHPGNVKRDIKFPAGAGFAKEPGMSQEEIAAAAVYMACQPPHVNVLEIIQLPKDQLYLGRG
jgi:NAD(P)-dependent dehydrogenase (short-subunit alcohol dehydrogenase family)